MIYLDNSATTRQYDEVTELIYELSKNQYANSSSLHAAGFEASKILKESRERLGKFFPHKGKIYFNSGGTEGDNTALFQVCQKMKRQGKKIITTSVEHPAVLECCKMLQEDGFEVKYLSVDANACMDPDELKRELTDDTILVSVMAVNNETGTIEPVNECAKIISEFNAENDRSIIFHTDAVQAFGKLELTDLNADIMTISGHKFHGPKGIGAIYLKDGLNLSPFIHGGGQEDGFRSGTENLPGIAGISMAAELAYMDLCKKNARLAELNDRLRNGLFSELDDIILNGPSDLGNSFDMPGSRCLSVINVSFLGTRGEVILHTLEQDGIMVSTGSACHSHHTGDSHVLSAMGLSHKEIEGAVRFSLSEFNTEEEIDFTIEKVRNAVTRFRKLGTFR